MKKLLGITLTVFLLISCSATYMAYRQDMFEGVNFLRQEEYQEARACFMKALEEQRDARSLALVATANYKLKDLTAAERYLTEAENLKQTDFSYLRIIGYKALTFLKESRKAEGMEALKQYIDTYNHVYPMPSIATLEKMWKKDNINMEVLESLIDEQVNTYEDDIELYRKAGVGWYQRFPPGDL